MTKIKHLFCAENVENHAFCCAKNVENHAIFVEGFWSHFYARGRFMKYSMSVYTHVAPMLSRLHHQELNAYFQTFKAKSFHTKYIHKLNVAHP